jgi:hypothetical protein
MAVVVASALAFFGPVVWPEIKLAFSQWRAERQQQAWVRRMKQNAAANRLPAPALAERPGDRIDFPREAFSLRYQGNYGFAADTKLGIAVQDRVGDPDSTYALWLAETQIDTLYEAALAGRMFSGSQPSLGWERWAGATGHGGTLILRCGEHVVSYRWYPVSDQIVWSDDLKRLNAYVGMVHRMVGSHPATEALPPPRSMYID